MDTPLLVWLREQIAGWTPSIVGVFREDASHDWPLSATSPSDLREQLVANGHLLPLPSEPAALANVMEIEIRSHLMEAVIDVAGGEITGGTERSYPDLEFSGDAFGGGFGAVDIKCARRRTSRSGRVPVMLNNRIALYTGNTYFLWPQLKFGGIMRPFDQYEELLSIVAIYTFEPELPQRITEVEVVVHETWRIASRSRASATREYIGSVQSIEQVVTGLGEFATADEFYSFWRDTSRHWKKSPEAEKLLRQALRTQG